MEEISRLSNIQAMAWVLLASFIQIYNENDGQKAKFVAKETVVAEK